MRRTALISRSCAAFAALAMLAAIPSDGVGQNATFTPFAGYRVGGSLTVKDGDLKLASAPFFGGQLDFRVRPDATAAVVVDYQPTTLRLKEFGAGSQQLFDMNVWYFQAGGTLEVLNKSGPVPFVVGTLGMSWFDPSGGSEDADSEYGFAGVFGAGAKIPFQSGRMGLRLQARVLLNSIYGGGQVWCGPGWGCSVSAGGFLGPVQFDFGGGLTFGGH